MIKTILFMIVMSISTLSFADIYRIRKGNHHSGIRALTQSIRALNFTAKFDNSGRYNLGNINQFDINKLYGFSDCFTHHHKNSARFGWVWNEETYKMEIHAYTYANGIRNHRYMTSVALNQTAYYSISISGSKYIMTANGLSISMPRGCDSRNANGYKLYPYFGGDEVAPHDITIEIN